MNTPEMYQRVYFHIGRQQSRRYRRSHIADSIVTATDDFINDRYDNVKRNTKYSFERFERIRKELGEIVVYAPTIAPSATNTFTFPGDLRYSLLCYVTVANIEQLLDISPLDESDRERNDFLKAENDYPYAKEVGRTYLVRTGDSNATNLKLYYIRTVPAIIISNTDITAGATALTITKKYMVTGGSVTHNAITYTKEQYFTAVSAVLTGTGTVCEYTDSIMPSTAHEEISRRASSILLQQQEYFEKKQGQDIDILKQ